MMTVQNEIRLLIKRQQLGKRDKQITKINQIYCWNYSGSLLKGSLWGQRESDNINRMTTIHKFTTNLKNAIDSY